MCSLNCISRQWNPLNVTHWAFNPGVTRAAPCDYGRLPLELKKTSTVVVKQWTANHLYRFQAADRCVRVRQRCDRKYVRLHLLARTTSSGHS